MAPSARVSSGVCCCEVDQCLDLLYDLDEWKGRLSYVILHGTLPTSDLGDFVPFISDTLSEVILASRRV